jgi:3-hydroxyisobutyrate dehydrogenase
MNESIGFIGTGIMGSGMVRNLVRKGYRVGVWNRTKSKAAALADELHIRHFEHLAELACESTTVMTCLRASSDVESVLTGIAGSSGHVRLIIECSTIDPEHTRNLAVALRNSGIGFVDAPVSGGSEGAAQGTLSVMVGATGEDYRRALPVLSAIGTRVSHIGAVGSGQLAKLVNQILVVVNMAVSEALTFGRSAGLDLAKVIPALEHGAGGSWMLSKRAPQVLDGFWGPGFTIDLQQKDLDLVLTHAKRLGVTVPAVAVIHQMYAKLQAAGYGDLGNHALIRAFDGGWA